MKRSLLFLSALAFAGALLAETTRTLTVASIETAEERAEAFFQTDTLPSTLSSGSTWNDVESKILLARFNQLAKHQAEVYSRYAKTDRGRALLLAKDFFMAYLMERLKGSATVEVLTAGQLPATKDVALLRLVIEDQTKTRDAAQTVRTQVLVVSAEDLQGKLLLSAPITAVSVRTKDSSASFDADLFREALGKAADAVAAHFGAKAEAVAAPQDDSFDIGAVTWDTSTARVSVCTLLGQRIAPSSRTLLAGLQPQVMWLPKITSSPLAGTNLGIGTTRIGGVTYVNNSTMMRGYLLPAFRKAGLKATLRGAQSDKLRAAQGIALPSRQVSVQILSYQETLTPSGATTTLPLQLAGRVTMSGLVTVTERTTSDILCAEVVTAEIPIEHILDENNLETTPFDPCTACQFFAQRVAETVKNAVGM